MTNIHTSINDYNNNSTEHLKCFIAEADGSFKAISNLTKEEIIEAGRALVVSDFKKRQINTMESPVLVKNYLQARIEGMEQEVFLVMFLDNRHQVIADEIMFYGTFNAASIYPREVAKRALQLNAAAVILSHNHPSGNLEPSSADINITKRLKDALKLIDTNVLDHIIVGKGSCTSFAEKGLL